MPNHVRLLILPLVPVCKIMRWVKGSSARAANRILDRTPQPFRQDESYDHYLRRSDQLSRTIAYMAGETACPTEPPDLSERSKLQGPTGKRVRGQNWPPREDLAEVSMVVA